MVDRSRVGGYDRKMFVKAVIVISVLVGAVSLGLAGFFVAAPECKVEARGELKSGKYRQTCECNGWEITVSKLEEEEYVETKCLGVVESMKCELVDEVEGEALEVDCGK